jgi:hypothetical protein
MSGARGLDRICTVPVQGSVFVFVDGDERTRVVLHLIFLRSWFRAERDGRMQLVLVPVANMLHGAVAVVVGPAGV